MKIKLANVSSRFGAPMGRTSEKLSGKVRLQIAWLNSGGYDSGGAYWGLPFGVEYLFVAEDEQGNQAFVRAVTRGQAKQMLRNINPGIKFWR